MLVRIVQFILGALLAAGGGYLAWTHRIGATNVFPPGTEGMPWLAVVGVLGISGGVTLLVSAVHPRPNRRAWLAARAAKREETLGAAEAYYSERARAADRDWRSGDIPPPAPARPSPPPTESANETAEARPAVDPAPQPAPPTQSLESAAPSTAAKPVATAMPPNPSAPTPFPSVATLKPIPKATEVPPSPVAAAKPPEGGKLFPEIRAAIAEGRLDEADKMLNAERETAQGLALAELTGLAGDHAAAAGRQSHAKWLWRRALARFGELSALDAPAARAVAEQLRLAD